MEAEALKFVAIGLMAFGMFGAALGVGNVFAALINAISRNPETESKAFKYAIIGGGMAEAMGLFALVVALILMYQ